MSGPTPTTSAFAVLGKERSGVFFDASALSQTAGV